MAMLLRSKFMQLTCLVVLLSLGGGCIALWQRFTAVDLDGIKQRGTLKVLTAYNASSYFLYRGQPMGFEYELLRRLADHLGLKLEIVLTSDMDNIAYMLDSGKGDLVAASIIVTMDRKRQVQFTDHLMTTRQVLIQRRPGAAPAGVIQNALYIKDPIQLIGKTVHVRRNSEFYQRLQNLSQEIGGRIPVKDVAGDVITEELIRKVVRAEIDYTVADEPTALINQAYYGDLDVSVPISFPQRVAWVVSRNSPELLAAVNEWIAQVKGDTTLSILYNKYYRDPRGFRERVSSEYYAADPDLASGKLSIFDDLLKEAASDINWDWRLLAALAYQESRFIANARSWAGARGLMQVMPATAALMGVRGDLNNPQINVRAGAKYLAWVRKNHFQDITDETEKLKFIMASYNAGPGHVEDARLLARKHNKNPNVWDDETAPFIVKLSDPFYYNNFGVRYGYCRGEEPFNYVRKIMERYEQYKKFIPGEEPAPATEGEADGTTPADKLPEKPAAKKPAPKPAAKPAARPTPRPAAKPAPKPAPKPVAKPPVNAPQTPAEVPAKAPAAPAE